MQQVKEMAEKIDTEAENPEVNKKRKIINRWIEDNSRASFNIPSSFEFNEAFVWKNLSAISRLIEVRKFCESCHVENYEKCPYMEEQRDVVKRYENQEGLKEGTITPNTLKSSWFERRGRKNKPIIFNTLMRPTIFYRANSVHTGWEICPIAPRKPEDAED